MSPRTAITVLFALNGFLFGSLYGRMPALRDNLSLSNGELGLGLLAITLAMAVAAVPAGALIARFSSRATAIAGVLLAVSGLPIAAGAESFAGFVAGLAIYGTGTALVDVAMNVKGLAVERDGTKRIFGSLHASFSFGGFAGLMLGAAAAALGVEPLAQFLIAAGLGVAVIAVIRPAIGAGDDERAARKGPMFVRPDRALAIIGIVGFCVLLAEGSVGDWGAVFLHDEHNSSEAVAAIGVAAFELTLAFGRLAIDPMSGRFGSQALIRVGGATAAIVMTMVLLAPSPGISIIGLLVLGAAMAPLFPMTLRAVGPGGPSMAFATSCGYAGLMAGPAAIGGLAELFDLRAALMLIIVCCVMGAVLAPRGTAN